MTFTAGSSGHLKAHNDLRAAVLTEAARFGLTPPNLAGPFVGGEPNHIGAHNDIAAAIRAIATAGGIDIDGNFSFLGQTFPDTAHLGDPGHPSDHDLLWDAVDLIQSSPAWNSATGGTITEVDNYNGTGEKWRVHTFTANDTLDMAIAAQPCRVLVVGGGGGGGGADGNNHGGGGFGAPGVEQTSVTISAGSHPVAVGGGGGGSGWGYGGSRAGAGSVSTFHGITGPGGLGGYDLNPDGGGTGGPVSDITGTSVQYGPAGRGVHSWAGDYYRPTPPNLGWGGDGGKNTGPQAGNPGGSGVVVVAYRIG